jgi:hypothetical protein
VRHVGLGIEVGVGPSRQEHEKARVVFVSGELARADRAQRALGGDERRARLGRPEGVHRRRDEPHARVLEHREHLLHRVLRLVRMEHLVAEPREQQRLVLQAPVQAAVAREHFLLARW